MIRPTLGWRRLAAAVAAAMALAGGAARAQNSSCSCADVADLANRVCEARAAASEYTHQINRLRQDEQARGAPVPYSAGAYRDDIQPCVQEAINQVANGSAEATADTNNACQVTFKGNPSACMKDDLAAHEAIHVAECMQAKMRDEDGLISYLRGLVSDFRDGTTLVDLLNEERTAYQLEVNHALSELMRLAKSRGSCPGLPQIPPGSPMLPSIVTCPPPKPRPPQNESKCKFR